MTNARNQSARVQEARARLSAIAERLILQSVAADYRRGRDPSDNLKRLLDLQELKRRLGFQGAK